MPGECELVQPNQRPRLPAGIAMSSSFANTSHSAADGVEDDHPGTARPEIDERRGDQQRDRHRIAELRRQYDIGDADQGQAERQGMRDQRDRARIAARDDRAKRQQRAERG